jgi:hypothetical protein
MCLFDPGIPLLMLSSMSSVQDLLLSDTRKHVVREGLGGYHIQLG